MFQPSESWKFNKIQKMLQIPYIWEWNDLRLKTQNSAHRPHIIFETLSHVASTGKVLKIVGKSQVFEGIRKYFTEYYGEEFHECVQESLISLCEYHPKTQEEPSLQFRKAMRHFHMSESVVKLTGRDTLNSPMLLFIYL